MSLMFLYSFLLIENMLDKEWVNEIVVKLRSKLWYSRIEMEKNRVVVIDYFGDDESFFFLFCKVKSWLEGIDSMKIGIKDDG